MTQKQSITIMNVKDMRKVLLIMTLLLTMVAQGAWADGTIDCTPSDKNKVLCDDGSIYNNVSAAEADNKTPVAKIIVVDTENHKGLALALSDEGQMNYSNAQTACENKTTSTPVTNATWAIPSKDEWDQMITAAGSYTALRDGFSGIGGTNISSASMMVLYWTRTRNTEYPNLVNWTYDFSDTTNGWRSSDQGGTEVHVRLCLQFNIPIPTHNAALATGTPTGWSITPTTPEEGSTVTVSYTGQHRVKSVKVVKKVAAKTLAEATLEDIGKIAGKDGKIYATKAAAEAVATGNAVAMIAYVGSETGVAGYTHGLALALTDESSSGMYWNDAKTACTNKNTSATVESASWMLPSKDQWNKMIDACKNVLGDNNDSRDLRDGFTSVGGSNMESKDYWSSTEYENDSNKAWMFNFGYDCWYDYPKAEEAYPQVRACLAF